MLRSPRSKQANNSGSIKIQLLALGQAMSNVINYSHTLAAEPDLGKAELNLSQYFGFDKSIHALKNQRLHELLSSEKKFYSSLLLATDNNIERYNENNNPREALISVLSLQPDKFDNCISAYSALRAVGTATKHNASALESVFRYPIGSSKFNSHFLLWLQHLPKFIEMLAPATTLIEIYQQIEPAIRKDVSIIYKSLDTGSSEFMQSYFISIPQRIAKYHLLLRDIHKKLRQAASQNSFHVVFDDFNSFMTEFEQAIDEVQSATKMANHISEQRSCLKRSMSENNLTQDTFLTAQGTLPIYSAHKSKREQLLSLHNSEFANSQSAEPEEASEDNFTRPRTKTAP